MRTQYHYEPAPEYPDRYRVDGWRGIAVYVAGWHTESDEDTDWSGMEKRSGLLAVVMVGDDAVHLVDPDELSVLGEFDYCAACGQIGCTHDGRDRDDS